MPPAHITHLLDTDIVIDILREHPPAEAWFKTVAPGVVGLPGYVVMELYQNVQSNREMREVDGLIAPLPILWPLEADCSLALAEYRRLRLAHGIGILDSLIAATARSANAILCTFNVKHYRVLPWLNMLQPYRR
jgi:predicted nucleic acid-binding protein